MTTMFECPKGFGLDTCAAVGAEGGCNDCHGPRSEYEMAQEKIWAITNAMHRVTTRCPTSGLENDGPCEVCYDYGYCPGFLPEAINFSRHPFNTDQRLALRRAGFFATHGCKNPFFKSSDDLIQQTEGLVASVVAPMGMLLEALASQETGGWSSVIIDWVADEAARKRGRFATRGMRVFHVEGGKITLIHNTEISPKWENDYKTGEEFPYEGGDSTR